MASIRLEPTYNTFIKSLSQLLPVVIVASRIFLKLLTFMVGFPNIMGNPGLAFEKRQYKCGLSQVIQISRSIGSKTRFFDLLHITVQTSNSFNPSKEILNSK